MWIKIIFDKYLNEKNSELINKFFKTYVESEAERIRKTKNKDSKDFISLIEEPSEEELANNEMINYLNEVIVNAISKQYSEMHNIKSKTDWNLKEAQKINNLYKKYVSYEFVKEGSLNQLVFDIKRKQLYSTLYENMRIKKLITNGGVLKELKIFVKKQKKNITVYGFNIKKMFNEIANHEYIIEIVGCKNQIFKIIKYIKKYHKQNCVFVFTPKRSFFKNQFKKISSIKRKMTKRYIKSLYL